VPHHQEGNTLLNLGRWTAALPAFLKMLQPFETWQVIVVQRNISGNFTVPIGRTQHKKHIHNAKQTVSKILCNVRITSMCNHAFNEKIRHGLQRRILELSSCI
jgi:predicted PP-loop superfamily ATPase